MSEEPRPEPARVRMSDADRQALVERLLRAAGEGRLTLNEFDRRVAGVLAASRFGEVEPFLLDLPGGTGFPPALERAQLCTTGRSLKREGRWVVSRRLRVTNKAGSVKLDFTDAVVPHHVVEVDLEVFAGITTLVLPRGATLDVELTAGNARVRGVPTSPIAGQERHFVVRTRPVGWSSGISASSGDGAGDAERLMLAHAALHRTWVLIWALSASSRATSGGLRWGGFDCSPVSEQPRRWEYRLVWTEARRRPRMSKIELIAAKILRADLGAPA
ncbi:DUF1707 SHOCT-like domain-containing protein [Actinoplanes siamensis]|uniref:DUF1707 domain-containing protein n=1 Tax=Actinoplanes siamensis TaxID=1223317 RepID=A0A919NEP3_9ACTN|nr:DUF1707 domain-containing protein [Actinoplanes siamensis]GIF09498.1 hypothetical protein Asi03nite_70360 [Actinoplanes siamensis]